MDPLQTLRFRPASLGFTNSAASLAASVVLVLVCVMPVFTAERGRLTSDESLYSSEALSIYLGRGPQYTTGRPITHRAPLFPALLAADFAVAGVSLDAGSWVPRIATAANALLVLLIARRIAGPVAGLVAGLATASSAYLNGFGASLYLDGVQTTFVLSCLLLLCVAGDRRRAWPWFGAGLLLGLAVLTKEAGVLLLPLPLAAALIGGATPAWRRKLAAWVAGLVLSAGGWWVWVYSKIGSIYLLGDAGSSATRDLVVLGAASLFVTAVALIRLGPRLGPRPGKVSTALGFGLLLGWGAAFIVGLEWQSWEHPRSYLSDVPLYFANVVVPAIPAFPLSAGAFAWAAVRAGRDRGAALLVSAGGLYLAFVIFFANRELSLRDGLPFLYFGFIALGCAAAWLLDWGSALARRHTQPLLAAAGAAVVLVASLGIAAQGFGRVDRAAAVGLQDDWDNAVAKDTAAWLEASVAPGTPIMSTRLYYSQVFFLTKGRFPVHQLPTVLVDVRPDASPILRARSTLFRWEPLPDRTRLHWVYLARYPQKSYYVGLAEEDILADIRERGTQYVVVNGTDIAFSSLAFEDYFDSNPAFTRVYERRYTDLDATVIYRVDLERLGPIASPLHVTSEAHAGLLDRFHGNQTGLVQALDALNGGEVTPEP